MLRVTDLIFDYSDKLLLQNVNFLLKPGAVLHIKGANGAGKTTLLKLLAGLLLPVAGKISCNEKICYVGHQNGVSSRLTPAEHAQFDLEVTDKHILDRLLARLGLHAVRDVLCGLLSAGQKRRMGLLRLLTTPSKLWLLDEPLVGLDTAGIQVLGELMTMHLKQGGSIVLTSHQALPFGLDSNVLQALVL
jgi:heme exporter protein A